MISSLPPDHPPIPTTSTAQFPSRPPPACPMSQLAATRPPSPTAQHPYAGEVFTLGTRNSKLAMVQTEIVRRELEERWPGCEIRIFGMTTLGDNVQSQPLYTFGGKALWTKELEVALLSNQVDAIVHSLKDVPTEFPPGCELGAVLEREDPSDALVVKDGLPYTSLEEMPEGSVIGTSSVRRVAQLRRKFPGLKFADVRGNLGTRLRKLDDPNSSYTALILASAGLLRLNMGHRITSSVASPTLYHAVGQGAIGVEIREGDERARAIIGSLECWKTSWRTRAERMMLRVLEGGCSVPVGCETKLTEVFVKGGEGDTLPSSSPKKVDTHGLIVEKDGPPVAVSPEQVSDFVKKNANGRAVTNANGIAIAEPDDTQGIPDGHPAVNPAAVCPVTGKTLPAAPISPRLAKKDLFPLPSLHNCTHRPGLHPSCPSSTSLTHHATLTLTGTITSLSGTRAVFCTLARRVHSVIDCEQLGADVAKELVEGGGKEILTELGRHVKEVGTSTSLDGRPIPLTVPGDSVTDSSSSIPITVPGAPSSPPAIFALSKSPHSHRTVFKEGEAYFTDSRSTTHAYPTPTNPVTMVAPPALSNFSKHYPLTLLVRDELPADATTAAQARSGLARVVLLQDLLAYEYRMCEGSESRDRVVADLEELVSYRLELEALISPVEPSPQSV